MLQIRPMSYKDAAAYVQEHHRHNKPPPGYKFAIACYDGDRLCGVAMVGRPVARALDDGLTLEVNRCCTDGSRNACSCLYGACQRAAKALGYKTLYTYTLVTEPGTSLRASNWICEGETGSANGWRGKRCGPQTPLGKKLRWRYDLNA